MRASSRANSVVKRRSRINIGSAVNGNLATGQHAIDHAAVQSRRTTEAIDKAGLWPCSVLVEDFQRSARSVRSRVKVPLFSDLLFRILF
jgi:hypothetical protein